jgi:hypothetical protein
MKGLKYLLFFFQLALLETRLAAAEEERLVFGIKMLHSCVS